MQFKINKLTKTLPYRIIIPTRGRYDKIPAIEALGLDKKYFTLVVNNEDEKKKYQKNFSDIKMMVSCSRSCIEARNYVLDKFPEGTKIIMVDDDVEGLYEMRGPGRSGLVKMTGDEIDKLIKKGFDLCEKNKTKFWGVYPTYNHYFMSNTIVPHGFIVGMWMGIIISDQRFDMNLKLKDDYGFTCQHIIKYKKIVRFNYVCVKAKYHTNSGGGSEYRTKEMEEQDVNYLIGKYPNFVQRNTKREGHEILLKFRPVRGKR
jgi:hypothetical protein